MATVKVPLMELRHRVWVVRMRVPEALRNLAGRSIFSQTTGHRNAILAAPVATQIVAGWKQQLVEMQDLKVSLDAENRYRYHPRGYTPPPPEPGSPAARKAARVLKAKLVAASGPSAEAIKVWSEALPMKPRQAQQYAGDVTLWTGTALPTPEGADLGLQAYADRRATAGDSIKTIQRRLAAIRRFLKDAGYRPDLLAERVTPKVLKDAPKAAKRSSFTRAQVEALATLAGSSGDKPLQDLITLALFTGARLEELATLKVSGLDWSRRSLAVSSKTEAGARDIPIHSALAPLLGALVEAVEGPDGYLLPSTARNKLGERGMAFGKRFGRLKTAEGYGSTLVFHSIRKTVATALQDCRCPEPTAADILGHEMQTMSYGVYSTGSSLETRREWLERALP